MEPGLGLDEQLRNGIDACGICLFVATKNSIASKWCLAEVGAFWGAKKQVVPWLADDRIDPAKLPPQLKPLLWTRDEARAVEVLKESVSKLAKTQGSASFPFVEAARDDDNSLPRIISIVKGLDTPPVHARLVQFSGDYVRGLLNILLGGGARVELLLAHPVQMLRTSSVSMRLFQLDKMAAFHGTVDADFPNLRRLDIRYYLSPASIRGIAIDDTLCSLSWYTHQNNWLRGHDNASVISKPLAGGKDPLICTFDRVWDAMWETAIPAAEDRRNVQHILRRRPQVEGQVEVQGIVVRGHGVASGAKRPGEIGTIHQQREVLGKWIDWTECWPGTINVSIAPHFCVWRRPEPTISRFKWSHEQPPEDFGLSRCRIIAEGSEYRAWVYCPLPRTKTQHLHDASIVEVIAPRIGGLFYGQNVSLSLDARYLAID